MRQELPETTATKQVLRGIVAPLHKQRSTVLERIAELSAALAAEREALMDIDAVLRRLDPSALPAKQAAKRKDGRVDGRATGNARRSSEVRAHVLEAIRQLPTEAPELVADGFTKTSLIELLKARGVSASSISVSPAIEAMHESGEIRLDRMTLGGGKLYRFVGDNGAVN